MHDINDLWQLACDEYEKTADAPLVLHPAWNNTQTFDALLHLLEEQKQIFEQRNQRSSRLQDTLQLLLNIIRPLNQVAGEITGEVNRLYQR